MSVRLIMVDVHKFVITLSDPIGVPAGMVMSWVMIITHVLVCDVSCMHNINCISHCNQILENVLLGLTTVRNCVWNWTEDMSVIVFQMDMS